MTENIELVSFDEEISELKNKFKDLFLSLDRLIEKDVDLSRQRQLSLTKLEESWMWLRNALIIQQTNKSTKAAIEYIKNSEVDHGKVH
jgi:hypothetical protein